MGFEGRKSPNEQLLVGVGCDRAKTPEAEETLQIVTIEKYFVCYTWCQNDETVTLPVMLYIGEVH